MYNAFSMSKQHTGGMPKGRYKRGNLGGPDRTKVEMAVSVQEKEWIREAAANLKITVSQYCATASVAAAKRDLAARLHQQ